ncbi:hypothetical protein J2W42_002077 [Rhizobium tibeticum]|nr:hypothetical protein [Rhizobium tibeticum]
MRSFVLLPPAAREDATELALLTDTASHGFASWLCSRSKEAAVAASPDGARTAEAARRRWARQLVRCRDCRAHGEIAGAAIGYGRDEGIRNIPADRPALKPVIDLQQMVIGS